MTRKPLPIDGKHFVKEGEWVGSIAISYGFTDWEKDVWNIPQNAALKKIREDPHLLAAGDVLYISQRKEKELPGGTEQKHRFKLKTPSEVLRIRILDGNGEPLKNEPYVLNIEFEAGGGVFRQQYSETDRAGVLIESIPSTAIKGKLILTKMEQEINFQLGYLTPMDLNNKKLLIRGVQERLKNLGFDPGPIDGIDGPRSQHAVQTFQEFCKKNAGGDDSSIIDSGPIDGIVGPKTLNAIKTYYGC